MTHDLCRAAPGLHLGNSAEPLMRTLHTHLPAVCGEPRATPSIRDALLGALRAASLFRDGLPTELACSGAPATLPWPDFGLSSAAASNRGNHVPPVCCRTRDPTGSAREPSISRRNYEQRTPRPSLLSPTEPLRAIQADFGIRHRLPSTAPYTLKGWAWKVFLLSMQTA